MTVVNKIKNAIEQRIVSGKLAPGVQINENKIAAVFKVSRTPVREALLALEIEGFVEIKPRAGIYVRELSQQELLDIFEVLAYMEGLCAQLATQRITKEGIQQLRLIQQNGQSAFLAQDSDRYDSYNQEFHEFIYQQCGNSYLVDQIQNMRKRTEPYRSRHLSHVTRMHLSWVEHQVLVNAIENKNPEQAQQAAMMHISVGGRMFKELGLSYPDWFVFAVEDNSSWREYGYFTSGDLVFPRSALQ